MRYLLVNRAASGLIAVVLAFSGCTVLESGVSEKAEFKPATDQKVGDYCEDDSWCRDGLSCSKKKCQPCGCLQEGRDCTMTAECNSGLYCSSLRKCAAVGETEIGDMCQTTADCEKGLVCAVVDLALRCVDAGNAQFGEACSSTLNCVAGLTCDTKVTKVIKDAGADVDADAEAEATDGGDVDASVIESSTVCLSADPSSGEKPIIPMWLGIECEDDAERATAYFEVPRASELTKDFYRLPFPNDIRKTATGLDLRGRPEPPPSISAPLITRYWQAAETDLTGFSTVPVVVFRFSEEIASDTLNGETLHFKDITPGSPTHGLQRNRRWQYNPNQTNYTCANAISIASSAPLRPNTTYAVYVTTNVAPEAGGRFVRSPDLDALLSATAPSDTALAAAYKAYAPFRTWLTESKTAPDTILNAAVFTTQDPEAMVSKLRTAVQSAPVPTISSLTRCTSNTTSPCDDGSQERRCGATNANFIELHGRIALPIFQQGTAPYEIPEQGGGIELNADGSVKVARTADVCFALTVPTQAPPESGYRLLIFGHGTGGGFTSAVNQGFAEELAVGKIDTADSGSVPAATLTIDLPQHGDRRGASFASPEELFFNYMNPRAARDNVLQGTADLMSLVRWAKNYTLAANLSPTSFKISFNQGRIAVLGHSQGATHASLMLPYEPDLVAVVLSGQGGYLAQSLLNKTKPYNIAAALPYALMDADAQGELIGGTYHPMLAIFQMYFDRVDPVNFAYRVWREPTQVAPAGHHLFMSYGLDDNYAPEQTQKAYAVNADLTVALPEISAIAPNSSGKETLKTAAAPLKENVSIGGTARTVGLRQYAPKSDEDGHFVAVTAGSNGRADVVRFLLQALAGLSPQIGK